MKSTVTCTPVLSRPAPVVEAVHLNLTLNRLDARKLMALVGVCEYVGITKQLYDALQSAGLSAELTGQPTSLLRHTTDPHGRVSLKFREAEATPAEPSGATLRKVAGEYFRRLGPNETSRPDDLISCDAIGVFSSWRKVPVPAGYRVLELDEKLPAYGSWQGIKVNGLGARNLSGTSCIGAPGSTVRESAARYLKAVGCFGYQDILYFVPVAPKIEVTETTTKIVGGVLCRPFAPGEAIQAGDKFDSPFSHLSPEIAPHTIGVVPAEGNRHNFWRPVAPVASNPAGEGYRLLQVGERLQEGDEVFWPPSDDLKPMAVPSVCFGDTIRSTRPCPFGYYRRPIVNKYQELFNGDIVQATDEVNHKSNPKELQEPSFGGWVSVGGHYNALDMVGKPVSSTDWGVFRRLTGGAK